ncbi:MAG: DNA polymerase III subunit alpha [Candidatus Tectomicrobia bacterium]|uniref:DNA polymerase III subunit alpha n=1 Tax=Tectimicrobiota bacterium TaxID=2528274 RepID=A0A932HZV2_UNCTE|nr:DNA polymerase III subunit alpha [Candidatus Tectomicrobia bacterium]
MGAAEFVHLHLHSQYSLLDGAARIDDLVQRGASLGMPAMALTDHGNMCGAIKFFEAARKAGVKPIIGCEVYVAPGSRHDRANNSTGGSRSWHMLLLAENAKGYRNLCELVTAGFTEGMYYFPRVDREILARHAEGLICTSACLKGEVNEALLRGDRAAAREAASFYKELFPGRYYLEIQDHGMEEDKRLVPEAVALARELALPLVATNDVHYLDQGDHSVQEVLICIQTGKTLTDPNRMHIKSHEFYLKSAGEMGALFKEVPEALRNTLAVAERCDFAFEFGGSHYPDFPIPDGSDRKTYLRKLAEEGLEQRLKQLGIGGSEARRYRERLAMELGVINSQGYEGYFLVVSDFIRYARENGIPVGPGRGSAAGSLAAFALGITGIDPLRYSLLFERFLNPERVSPPDIDIDFCMDRRDEVIRYVQEKYGRENVCQIITFGSMLAKGVLRDVGRVMDMPYGEVDRIAKLVPNELKITLDDALQKEPRLREAVSRDPNVGRLMETARKLEGNIRHAGTHAAGVVIAPSKLTDFVPLYKGSGGEVMTQFDMKDVEQLGLLKMDFLGLKTLTALKRTVDLVRLKGVELDLDTLPLGDEASYRLLSEGRTTGIFQLESRGIREYLRKLAPSSFEDLIAMVALYRPGPLNSGMVDAFINRKHGRAQIDYFFPELKPILESTYGVMVYQEQVMQISNALSGFSLGRADVLRKAMGKKSPELMAQQMRDFVEGAAAWGHDRRKVEALWDQIQQFAGYGFNKSHSAAYALIAYRTAYLKAHHPREFMAALLTCDRDNADKVIKDIAECRDMGIAVLPPDVNASDKDFTVEGDSIRFGLLAVKNVGEAMVDAILAARAAEGPFRTLGDFCRRVEHRHLNRRAVESLVKACAFDSLGIGRAQAMAALDAALEAGVREQRTTAMGQTSLFSPEEAPSLSAALPDVPEWPARQRLAFEKEVLGFYVSGHPLNDHQETIRRLANMDSRRLAELEGTHRVRMAGLIRSSKIRTTRAGRRMASFVLEDREGTAEMTMFPDVFEAFFPRLETEEPVLVEGMAEVSEEGVQVVVRSVEPLAQAQMARTQRMVLHLGETGRAHGRLTAVREVLARHPGEVPVLFALQFPEREVLVQAGREFVVAPSESLSAELGELVGEGAVYFE